MVPKEVSWAIYYWKHSISFLVNPQRLKSYVLYKQANYVSFFPFELSCSDAFELWCWRRLKRVPWAARRSNQTILKAINPEYSLEGLMLKLKLQYFGHLMWRANSLEETSMLRKGGECWRQEEKGTTEDQMVGWHHRLNGHEFEQALGDGEGQGSLECCSPWAAKSRTWLRDWTTKYYHVLKQNLQMSFKDATHGKRK